MFQVKIQAPCSAFVEDLTKRQCSAPVFYSLQKLSPKGIHCGVQVRKHKTDNTYRLTGILVITPNPSEVEP